MYIVDLFKRLSSKENIPLLIYLILNVFVTAGILSMFLSMFGAVVNFLIVLVVGLGLYLFSIVIALSPIGEFVIRIQTGCKKIKRKALRKTARLLI